MPSSLAFATSNLPSTSAVRPTHASIGMPPLPPAAAGDDDDDDDGRARLAAGGTLPLASSFPSSDAAGMGSAPPVVVGVEGRRGSACMASMGPCVAGPAALYSRTVIFSSSLRFVSWVWMCG